MKNQENESSPAVMENQENKSSPVVTENQENEFSPAVMKKRENEFSAFVGIDWGDTKHDVSVSSGSGSNPVSQTVDHTPEALGEWVMKLRGKYPDGQMAVCLEQSRGALIFHLLGYDFLTLFPVNPKSFARFREAFAPGDPKSDPADADLLRELVVLHRDRLRPWKPDDEKTRTMAFLAEGRRKAVNDRVRLSNRLRSALKMYFPQALDLVGDAPHSPMALDFLAEWPRLEDVRAADEETIRKFYCDHNSRSSELIRKRLDIVKSAVPLTSDGAVMKSSVIAVKMLVGQLSELNKAVDEFDKELKSLYDAHEDKDIFDSFPGAGKALGPRLLSSWGSDRDRYESAEDMQKYSGTAPVTRASGKSKAVVRRLACPKFLLQTFHEFANCSRRFSIWAEAYYDMLRERGKNHHMAIRALAFRWIRIMFVCWRDRTKYDEIKYLKALRKSNSPVLEFI